MDRFAIGVQILSEKLLQGSVLAINKQAKLLNQHAHMFHLCLKSATDVKTVTT